ncbi:MULTISPECIES: DUF5694 domain-containing protein [Pacificimonas]|nr:MULTISPECIES: DUF5694 domain-containing protein [Pacificimonas]MBZ6378949.1 hypothetical protein [Pacificimonas aurantium]
MTISLRVMLAALAVTMSVPAWAGPAPTVEVMVLGTYHFANPGADIANVDVEDVLLPGPQAEIEAIVEALSAWQPDRVLIERAPDTADYAVPAYAAYRAGEREPERSEDYQIGFRLADRLGHEAVYGFDERGEGGTDYFPFGAVQQVASDTGQEAELEAWMDDIHALTARMTQTQGQRTIATSFALMNTAETVAAEHSRFYLGLNLIGDRARLPGAELNAMWFMRNAKMFAKLQQIAEPEERVLVIVGAGHAYWLTYLAENTPGYTRVSPVPWLEKADALLGEAGAAKD